MWSFQRLVICKFSLLYSIRHWAQYAMHIYYINICKKKLGPGKQLLSGEIIYWAVVLTSLNICDRYTRETTLLRSSGNRKKYFHVSQASNARSTAESEKTKRRSLKSIAENDLQQVRPHDSFITYRKKGKKWEQLTATERPSAHSWHII